MNQQTTRRANYGLKEIIDNAFFWLRTKVLVPNARLIRFPIVIRGKKWIDFGRNLTTGRRCRFEVNGVFSDFAILLGDNVNIGDEVRISAAEKIRIGNNVLIGSKVLIIDNSHGIYRGNKQDDPNTPPNKRQIFTDPVTIEDNVWIGEGAVIQMGVTVGFGSIIGSNSVVTKDVPSKCIVGGVPAGVIKRFNDQTKRWEKN